MNAPMMPLRLPPGHELVSYRRHQVPAPGGIYLARFSGDLETPFGPARELRDREFLVELDGEEWIAVPTPGRFVTWADRKMFIDDDAIYGQTDGVVSTIDFKLVRRGA